ncbi:hypothetical protein N431DRAFT_144619 [Stipitochalara longipes BDJ]|nr:hypothetical protein N431DRAFT_144619 [Stipitochalara longipes BDJ]
MKNSEAGLLLTTLSIDNVKLWFAQKLRCKLTTVLPFDPSFSTASLEIKSDLLCGAAIPSMTASPQPSVLQRAASWVKEEKMPKCKASLDHRQLLRDDTKPFQCTRKCGKKWRDRDDWRKHEEINWPQKGWVCDLPASVVVADILICTHCGIPNPQMDHFQIHKETICGNKPFTTYGRVTYRKQHFKQHFKNVHPHVPCDDYIQSSHFTVDSNFPRRCGFCSHTFAHWKDRVEHIGTHFRDEGKDMTEWNDHTEGDHKSGDQKDDKHDDDDRNPDDASDSSNDDSDDFTPRLAPKTRVQAKLSHSKGRSSTTATSSTNRMLQSNLNLLEFENQSSTSLRDHKSFQPSLQHISPPHISRSRRPTVAGNRSSPFLHDVTRFLDASETPQYARASSSPLALEGPQDTLRVGRTPHQDIPQTIDSDDDGPTPNSNEDDFQREPPLDKIDEAVRSRSPEGSRTLRLFGNVTLNRAIGSIRSLSFSSSIFLTTILSMLINPLFLMGTQIHDVPVNIVAGLIPLSALQGIDFHLGAADVFIGTSFSTGDSGIFQTKLFYNDGEGKICIRTESESGWLDVRCLEGANPRSDTPITVLDWLCGPSIYFTSADNNLSGVDHMPLKDTWQLSMLRDQKKPAHRQSQLTSATWFNGTSSWLYYQNVNNQLREFGIDDYRDTVWRDGSIGPVGPALGETATGAPGWWWLANGSEVLEVYTQVTGVSLHGRVYMESVWTSDFYAIDHTPNTVSRGTPLTSMVIHQPSETMVLLAYVSSDGFLNMHARGTANRAETLWNVFSAPEIILQDNGNDTFLTIIRHEDGTHDVLEQCTVGKSSSPSCPAQFLDFDWSAMPASHYAAEGVLIIFLEVLAIFGTCFFWLREPYFQTDHGRELFHGLEMAFIAVSSSGFLLILPTLDEKDIRTYIILRWTLFIAVRLRLSRMVSFRCLGACTLAVLFTALPILAVRCSARVVVRWVHLVGCFVLSTLVFCLNISRKSETGSRDSVTSAAEIVRTRSVLAFSSSIPQEFETPVISEHSSRSTVIGTLWRCIFHLLGDPINFFWTLATPANTVSSAKPINNFLGGRHHEAIVLIGAQFWSLGRKVDHENTGDRAIGRLPWPSKRDRVPFEHNSQE